MKGAADRWVVNWIAGVSLLVTSVAGAADVTDNNRMFRSYTRETATVSDGQVRLELQGLEVESQGNTHVNVVGIPVSNVDTLTGGLLNLIASYGVAKNAEAGFVVSGLIQSTRTHDLDARDPNGNLVTPGRCAGGPTPSIRCTKDADCGVGSMCKPITTSNDTADVGDFLVYTKFKHQVAEHCWLGGGVEVTMPNSSEHKGFTTGEFSFNPVVSTRYQRGPLAFGAHAGMQMYAGETSNAFNYSIEGVVRATETYALRAEWAGRIFEQGGTRIWDAQVYPGVDFDLGNNLVVRPTGMIKASTDALDWGIGVGLATTF